MSAAKKRNDLFAKMGLQLVHHQAPTLAGEAAMGLYTFCLLYSRLNELDGFIPLKLAERGWSGDVKANRAHLKTLAIPSVALLIEMVHPHLGHGFLVCKYEEFNETKMEIAERRTSTKARVRKSRAANVTRYMAVTSSVTNAFVPVSDSLSVLGMVSSEGVQGETPPPTTPVSAFVAGASGSTPPPAEIPVTPDLEAACVMAGAPKPTRSDVQLMLTHAHGKGKRSRDWPREVVAWMLRQKSYDRDKPSGRQMVQPVPEGGPAWKMGKVV